MMRPSEKIERDGWCQGSFHKGARACVMGAIGELPTYGERSEFLKATLRRQPILIKWNDTLGRTKEEVIALLKEVEAEVYGIEHPVPWAEKGLAYASISSRAD